jgi:hypothetical protein
MMWHVTALLPDARPGYGYLAGDLHPQDGPQLILTGLPELCFVFETPEKAKAFAALANLHGSEVHEGVPLDELPCPPILVVPIAGN